MGKYISPRMLIQCEVNLRRWTHRWWKLKQRRATNCVLQMRLKKHSKMAQQSRETTTRQSGNTLRTPPTGFIWPRHKKRDENFGRQDPTPLLFTIQCRLIASKKWYPRMERKLCTNDSHASASSKNNAQKCLEFTAATATAAERHLWELRETCAGERHPGNRSSYNKGSTGTLVANEEKFFQGDLRIQGVPKDAVLEDQERMFKIQEVVDKQRTGYKTESIINDSGKKGTSNVFSEPSRRTSKKWEVLNCTNWEGFPKQFNAQRA